MEDNNNLSDVERLDLVNRTVDNFNDEDVGQYLLNGYRTRAKIKWGEMLVEVTVDKQRIKSVEKIRQALEGQCSDGWGEGWEQQEQIINGVSYYVSTWSADEHVELRKIK